MPSIIHLRVDVDVVRELVRHDAVARGHARHVTDGRARADADVGAARVVAVRLEPVVGVLARRERRALAHVDVVDVQRREADRRPVVRHGVPDERGDAIARFEQPEVDPARSVLARESGVPVARLAVERTDAHAPPVWQAARLYG